MQSNQTESVDEIKKSLVIAIERTEMNLTSIDNTSLDIYNEFKHLRIDKIREAIRKGSLGAYGQTYRMSTQEVCTWIRKYICECNSKLNL